MAIVKKETANPYLKQYFTACGLNDGDAWEAPAYMRWIDAMHDEFRRRYCLIPDIPYTQDEQDLFIEWLAEKAVRKKNT